MERVRESLIAFVAFDVQLSTRRDANECGHSRHCRSLVSDSLIERIRLIIPAVSLRFDPGWAGEVAHSEKLSSLVLANGHHR